MYDIADSERGRIEMTAGTDLGTANHEGNDTAETKSWERSTFKDEAKYIYSANRSFSVLMPLLAALLVTPFTFWLRLLPYSIGMILLRVFIYNPMKISVARARLNMNSNIRNYSDLLYGFGRRYLHFTLVMLLCDLRVVIRLLLLPLGIIAAFQQRLVPYLLAEHPNLSAREAILISKDMMKDDKMNSFILDLSFIGYLLLSGITFGLFGILYGGPVSEQTMIQLYRFLKYKDAYQKMDQKERGPTTRCPAVVTSVLPAIVILSVVTYIVLTPQYKYINDLRWNPSDKHDETDDRFIETVQQENLSAEELLSYSPKQLGSDAADALVIYLHGLYAGDRSGGMLDNKPLTRDEEQIIELLSGICASEDAVIWLRLLLPAAERLRDTHIESLYAAPLSGFPKELDDNVFYSNVLLETLGEVYYDCYSYRYESPAGFEKGNDEQLRNRFVYNYGKGRGDSIMDISQYHAKETRYLASINAIPEQSFFRIISIMEYSVWPDIVSCFFASYNTLSPKASDVIPVLDYPDRNESLYGLYYEAPFSKWTKCLSAITRARYLSHVCTQYEIVRDFERNMEYIYLSSGYNYFRGAQQTGLYHGGTIQVIKAWNKAGIALFYEMDNIPSPGEEELEKLYRNTIQEIADPKSQRFSVIKTDMYTDEAISAAVELMVYGERAKQTYYQGIQEIPKDLYARVIDVFDYYVSLRSIRDSISMAKYEIYEFLESSE